MKKATINPTTTKAPTVEIIIAGWDAVCELSWVGITWVAFEFEVVVGELVGVMIGELVGVMIGESVGVVVGEVCAEITIIKNLKLKFQNVSNNVGS